MPPRVFRQAESEVGVNSAGTQVATKWRGTPSCSDGSRCVVSESTSINMEVKDHRAYVRRHCEHRALTIDQRGDPLAKHFELGALVCKRPQKDTLSAATCVRQQLSGAFFGGPDRQFRAQFVGGTVEHRHQQIRKYRLGACAVLGHITPHRRDGVRKPRDVAPTHRHFRLNVRPCLGKQLRGGVVTGSEPAIP